MPSRLETLRSLVAQGTADPFARYGLAMELRTQGQLQEAWQIFEALLQGHPDYIAAYAPAADTLVGLLRNQEARDLLHRGIEVCERKGQSHARDQLQSALAAVG
jgi:cytochrome c-type biogenesis protein CcmH/NrfG